MTRTTNARIAGLAFLVYIAAALPGEVMYSDATSGEGTAAKLGNVAQHVPEVRAAFVLAFIGCFCALVLAVTLYAVTRDHDNEVAMLGMTCRVAEGVVGVVGVAKMAQVLSLATSQPAGAATPETVGDVLLSQGPGMGALLFAIGSTCFAWLLLRGRMIPRVLAWIGLPASMLLVVALPLQYVGLLPKAMEWYIWMPMLAFEVPLGVWFIVKGVAAPAPRMAAVSR
jgi:hypothetical protein